MASKGPRMESNLLLRDIEYEVTETPIGVWRRFLFSDGRLFREFTSHATWGTLPLIHFTEGPSPETGRRVIACGVIAIGRMSVGVVAIGQFAIGLFAIGQLAIGAAFGLGQAATGVLCIAQFGLGFGIAFGQFVAGYVAVGQMAVGQYAMGQFAIGESLGQLAKDWPALAPWLNRFR